MSSKLFRAYTVLVEPDNKPKIVEGIEVVSEPVYTKEAKIIPVIRVGAGGMDGRVVIPVQLSEKAAEI